MYEKQNLLRKNVKTSKFGTTTRWKMPPKKQTQKKTRHHFFKLVQSVEN